jgi:hypothetical protein
VMDRKKSYGVPACLSSSRDRGMKYFKFPMDLPVWYGVHAVA